MILGVAAEASGRIAAAARISRRLGRLIDTRKPLIAHGITLTPA
jgi:hypothetical protein